MICRRLGVDVWEVIESAATKPYGFMPFYPGPGVGGHCIPVDPSYLEWKMRNLEFRTRFIDLGNDLNRGMPEYVVQRATEILNSVERSVRGSRILVIGVAYKPNVGDVRESPGIDVITRLVQRGANVQYVDPHVASIVVHGGDPVRRVELEAAELEASDLVVITTQHEDVDWELVAESRTAGPRYARCPHRAGSIPLAHALSSVEVTFDWRRLPRRIRNTIRRMRAASRRRDLPETWWRTAERRRVDRDVLERRPLTPPGSHH